MRSFRFDKETFKKSVIYNVKSLFRKTIDEATPAQVFQAVAYAVKDVIIDEWIATHKEYEKQDSKTLYYLSMEFLMGRALGNNIINIMAKDEIREALDEMGFDLNVIEDQEPDAALGNGKRIQPLVLVQYKRKPYQTGHFRLIRSTGFPGL